MAYMFLGYFCSSKRGRMFTLHNAQCLYLQHGVVKQSIELSNDVYRLAIKYCLTQQERPLHDS